MGNFSAITSQLLADRPPNWEYLLFDYCLKDAIDRQLTVPCQMPTASEHAGSRYTFYFNGPVEGQKFIKQSIAAVMEFLQAMQEAVKFSSAETTECFGPPGAPGNPDLIVALAQRFARRIQVVRQKALEFECMHAVCEDPQMQIAADLYLRSCLRFVISDCQRTIDFVRSLGVRILEALESSNGKLHLVLTASELLTAHAPLLYQLSKEAKPARATHNHKAIAKPTIHVTFFDTETTGLGLSDEPISFGAEKYEVDSETGKFTRVIDTYYGLREPAVPVGDSAFRVHGISADELRGKRWNMDRVQEMLQADLLIAHNAEFDMAMLAKVITVDARRCACSMKIITDIVGQRHWISLEELADRFDLDRPSPHNALKDAQTLAQVVGQPLPNSVVQKTILWEMMQRHYGFKPLVSNNDNYIVWGHYTPDGILLYVWTARAGQPNGSDDFLLSYYENKYLPHGCTVVPINGDLTLDQAIQAKDELLKEHHATLLNIRNIYRPPNPVESESNGEFYALLDRGRALEKTDAEASILCYSTALGSILNRGYIPSESGLIGQIQVEINRASMLLESMLLKPLDRISLLLCRQGEPARAKAVLDEARVKFPAIVGHPAALPIVKRIEKALAKSAPTRSGLSFQSPGFN